MTEDTLQDINTMLPLSNNGVKSHNPGLRALLSIKNFTNTLDKDYAELLKLETALSALNETGLALMVAGASAAAAADWKLLLQEQSNAINGINETLGTAKDMIAKKATDGYNDLWSKLSGQLAALKAYTADAIHKGLAALPDTAKSQWEIEFVQQATPLAAQIVTHVESCRVLLQMIERYTPEELNAITKIVVDNVPADFTYEEAVAYQNDYYKALVNFKKEFKEEKNLWDKFLDILAGGTHQPPSERVMMERWLEGEKGDLE